MLNKKIEAGIVVDEFLLEEQTVSKPRAVINVGPSCGTGVAVKLEVREISGRTGEAHDVEDVTVRDLESIQ